MPHGCHIYAKTYDMADHALPHCKCVLQCCADYTCINIPDQETYNHISDTTPSIQFHIYNIIARCTDHGRILLKGKKMLHV